MKKSLSKLGFVETGQPGDGGSTKPGLVISKPSLVISKPILVIFKPLLVISNHLGVLQTFASST